MADPHWEFCCGKLIVRVICRNCFFTGVALESKIYPKSKSRKQKIACDFFVCRVVSFYVIVFWVIVIVFGDCGF